MRKSGDDVRNKLILARFGIMGLESLPLLSLLLLFSFDFRRYLIFSRGQVPNNRADMVE